MTCLDYHDGFLMVNALVCTVTHWTKLVVSHDIDYWVVMILLSYHTV